METKPAVKKTPKQTSKKAPAKVAKPRKRSKAAKARRALRRNKARLVRRLGALATWVRANVPNLDDRAVAAAALKRLAAQLAKLPVDDFKPRSK